MNIGKNKIKSTKEEIEKRINELNIIQDEIKKEVQVLHKEIEDIAQVKNKEYIGKCYKRDMYDEYVGSTIYYRVLEISESNSNNFWVLSVKYPYEDAAISTSYISKELINFLGNKEFFLRQLTPISKEEYNKALNDIYAYLADI